MIGRAVVVWVGLLLLAIGNGGFREAVLVPRLSATAAHAVSTLMLSTLIAALTWITSGWVGYRSTADGWTAGALWVAMTVAFEFLAGHYAFGKSWDVLLADYNVLQGRIWPLVLIVTLLAPVLAARR